MKIPLHKRYKLLVILVIIKVPLSFSMTPGAQTWQPVQQLQPEPAVTPITPIAPATWHPVFANATPGTSVQAPITPVAPVTSALPEVVQSTLPPPVLTATSAAQAWQPVPEVPVTKTSVVSAPATWQPVQSLQPAPAAPVISPVPVAQPLEPSVPVAPIIQTPTPAIPEEEKKDIYLNFENTDLASFVDYIAEIKKLNIIPDKALEASKISLTVREPLSIEGAWNIFLTVLEMAGFSIVKAGDVHKIIPKDKKINQPLPAYINVPYTSLPDNDLTIRYVTFLANIQVTDIQPLLESMLSTPNAIHAQKDMNAFIITDKSYNIKSAVKLIQELDQMGLPETVTVLRLKRVNAVDTRDLLKALITKPEGNPLAKLLGRVPEGARDYFSPTTKIIAEERTNSLILLGDTVSIDKIIKFITTHIDTEIKKAASPLHVYELQHIDAKQVASILKEVTAAPDSATGATASKYGSTRGGVKYFKNMTFQVDTDGNRLIVSCIDKQDWHLLKKTLDDLDKPQPQIALETLIVTVDSTDMKSLGGMLRNKKHGQIGKNVDFQSSTIGQSPSLQQDSTGNPLSLLGNLLGGSLSSAPQIAAAQGQTLLTFGPQANIWGLFATLKSLTNSSILSQPFFTVANNTAASIEVGSTARVVQDTAAGVSGYVSDTASTKVEVTPQINLDGVIRLKIAVNINAFLSSDNTIKSVRTLTTNVTVADGQVLVLGGFVQTNVSEEKTKTPILGDIPGLGWFFKRQTRTITKEYIFVFMAPTIVKPRQTPGMDLYTKMKLHQATDDIEDAVETKRTMDPIHNWFFNPDKENYSHKVIDFANARYQPTTVDIATDPYYRSGIHQEEDEEEVETFDEEPTAIKQAQQDQQAPVHASASPEIIKPVLVVPVVPVQLAQLSRQEVNAPVGVPVQPAPMLASLDQAPMSDTELAERRQKLRALLATPSVAASQENRDTGFIDNQKRESFKEIISQVPEQEPETLVIDQQKRNSLKEFLSASPTVAHNKNKNRPTSGRACA